MDRMVQGPPVSTAAIRRAIAEERRRFAQDLHDQSGQDLALLRIGLKRLERHVDSAEGLAHLRRLSTRLDRIGEDLGRAVHNLLPSDLDGPDLEAVVRRMLVTWSDVTGMAARLAWKGDPCSATAPPGQAISRVVQEALTNVAKHGVGVARVTVRIASRRDRIVMTFADDGLASAARPWCGIAPDPRWSGAIGVPLGRRTSLGLSGMRDRVARAGGRFRLFGPDGGGLALCARFPLAAPEAGDPGS